MQKWEYLNAPINEWGEYGTLGLNPDSPMSIHWMPMDELGARGWELVGVMPSKYMADVEVVGIFKRPSEAVITDQDILRKKYPLEDVTDTPCPKCNGKRKLRCSECAGAGYIIMEDRDQPCSACDASGKVPCIYCHEPDIDDSADRFSDWDDPANALDSIF